MTPPAKSFVFARCGFGLPRMFGFDEGFQIAETGGPEDAVMLDPGIDRPQRFGIELVDAVTALAMLAHQVRAAEQAEMFGDGGTGNGKGAGDLPGGLAATAKKVEDGPAGRIGEGLKGDFRVSSGRICNRSVTHNM